MTSLPADTPIGTEVARLTKTAALSEQSATPQPGRTQVHSDQYAQQMGFERALVPGVTLLGYITEMLADLFGNTWFEKGSVNVRFRRPVYNGEAVTAKAVIKDKRGENGATALVLDVSLEVLGKDRVAVVGQAACPVLESQELAR